jgi:hypothetical protein
MRNLHEVARTINDQRRDNVPLAELWQTSHFMTITPDILWDAVTVREWATRRRVDLFYHDRAKWMNGWTNMQTNNMLPDPCCFSIERIVLSWGLHGRPIQ